MFLCFEKIKKSSKSSAYLSVFIVNAHDDEKKAKRKAVDRVCVYVAVMTPLGGLQNGFLSIGLLHPLTKKKRAHKGTGRCLFFFS